MKFVLCIYCAYHYCDYPNEPLMRSVFDTYGDCIKWLNTHMGLNFNEKRYFISIDTMEV